jgi:hypothetical protein
VVTDSIFLPSADQGTYAYLGTYYARWKTAFVGEWYIDPSYANVWNSYYTTASNATAWINFNGYQATTTYYRSLFIGDGKQNTLAAFDAPNGRVGIGTQTPSYKLDVNGTVNSVSGYYANGTVGYTGTINLKDRNGSNCTVTVSLGLITGHTCTAS